MDASRHLARGLFIKFLYIFSLFFILARGQRGWKQKGRRLNITLIDLICHNSIFQLSQPFFLFFRIKLSGRRKKSLIAGIVARQFMEGTLCASIQLIIERIRQANTDTNNNKKDSLAHLVRWKRLLSLVLPMTGNDNIPWLLERTA